VDVQPEMLDLLMESVEEEGIEGVVPVLGEPDDPMLPAGSVDWILLVDVYHELENPAAMLEKMRASLAPAGRVALLEYRAEDDTGEHIRAGHRMSVRQVIAEWGAAGFQLADLQEFLPSQHLFVLQAARQTGAGLVGGRPILPHYDLADAVRMGLVDVAVTGTGSDTVSLAVRSMRPGPMVVTLPAGAYFDAPEGVSDMVARRDGMVILDEQVARPWRIEARRAQRDVPSPGPADGLDLAPATEHGDVQDALWLFQNADVSPVVAATVEQLAVWIVTEDVGWESLRAHARTTGIHPANATAFAAAYVNAAGIDIKTKRVWAEREQFLPSVTDEGLRSAFAELEER